MTGGARRQSVRVLYDLIYGDVPILLLVEVLKLPPQARALRLVLVFAQEGWRGIRFVGVLCFPKASLGQDVQTIPWLSYSEPFPLRPDHRVSTGVVALLTHPCSCRAGSRPPPVLGPNGS